MNTKNLLVFIFASAVHALAGAQWKWIDEAGRPVYSDQPPPPGVPPHRIQRQPGAVSPAAVPDAPPVPANASPPPPPSPSPVRSRTLRAAASSPATPEHDPVRSLQADNARLRDAHCTRTRQARDTLESGQRLSRTLPNGEREVLDDAARAAERMRLQGILASDCPTL